MAIWNILRSFGIFNDHLVHYVFFWCIFSGFGIMYQEKSGNPGFGRLLASLGFQANQNEMDLFRKPILS
jgi:hypothetical protein